MIDALSRPPYHRLMSNPETVNNARTAYNEAQSEFNRHPSKDTKEAYKAASASLNIAIHQARKNGHDIDVDPATFRPEGRWSNTSGHANFDHLDPSTAALLNELRQKQNEAAQRRYADPSEETQVALAAAKREYKNTRRKLDSVFAAKLSESTRRSVEKRALMKAKSVS